jgi:hypothetical protein
VRGAALSCESGFAFALVVWVVGRWICCPLHILSRLLKGYKNNVINYIRYIIIRIKRFIVTRVNKFFIIIEYIYSILPYLPLVPLTLLTAK